MDYANGKIYVLRDTRTDTQPIIYVGSTTSSLAKRLYGHKSKATIEPRPIHRYVNEEVGWDNVIIELHENYPCKDKNELCKREGDVVREFLGQGIELQNKRIEGRTAKERYQDNREVICEKVKQYRENNPEVIKQRKKDYYENNKEKIAEYKKAYQEANKDELNKKAIEYYEKNKAAILERLKQPVRCEVCQCEVTKSNFNRHNKSKKHKDNLAKLAN